MFAHYQVTSWIAVNRIKLFKQTPHQLYMEKKSVLVIVAHPDDETIWMGGTLLSNLKNWDTTILSLCRKNDADRAPKFKKICKKFYKAKPLISNLEDEKLNEIQLKEVTSRIKKLLENKTYDIIFTHGKNGEYSHIRHEDVHKAVNQMLQKGELQCKKLFLFSYLKRGKFCYPNKKSNKFINLNADTSVTKKYIIQNLYGFSKGGFEDICCRIQEAFNIQK